MGTFPQINKDTSAKFIYMSENAVGYHVSVNVKALHTESWDPVLFVLYRERFRKIPHK